MKKVSASILIAAITGLTACTAHSKKILVYARSDIKVDETQENITVTEGTAFHQKELDFKGSDPVTLNVVSPSGKFTLVAAEDGLYIDNLKNDTLVGSYQHVGAEGGDAKITQDLLKQKVDSLQKLVAGQNVNAANRNYFILPGKIVKITSETRAKVFGPFTTIPGSFDASSVPEIYKFYSISEVREIISKLAAMSK
jgi:hypothetical protein